MKGVDQVGVAANHNRVVGFLFLLSPFGVVIPLGVFSGWLASSIAAVTIVSLISLEGAYHQTKTNGKTDRATLLTRLAFNISILQGYCEALSMQPSIIRDAKDLADQERLFQNLLNQTGQLLDKAGLRYLWARLGNDPANPPTRDDAVMAGCLPMCEELWIRCKKKLIMLNEVYKDVAHSVTTN